METVQMSGGIEALAMTTRQEEEEEEEEGEEKETEEDTIRVDGDCEKGEEEAKTDDSAEMECR